MLLQDMKIVFMSSDNLSFFKRTEILLRSSGCKHISFNDAQVSERCIVITDDVHFERTDNPVFIVSFNSEGIFLSLKHPPLLGTRILKKLLIEFSPSLWSFKNRGFG